MTDPRTLLLGQPDGMCRHCGLDLWVDTAGRWRSYQGLDVERSPEGAPSRLVPRMSRFCARERTRTMSKIEHAPVRTDRLDLLEEWLAQE